MPTRRAGRASSRPDHLIATRVKALMLTRDWDQKELAVRLELSEGYISRILSGERPWPIPVLFRAAETLEVSIGALDPELEQVLIKDLLEMEIGHGPTHLQVLQRFVQDLPQVQATPDLEALIRLLEALGSRAPAADA